MGSTRMNMRIVVLLVMVVAVSRLGAPVAGQDTSCMTSIAFGCTGGDTTAQVDQCCTVLKAAMNLQRQCFCLLQPTLAEQGANPNDIAALFTACGINGNFNSLCPNGDSSSTSNDNSSPVDNPSSSSSSDSSTTTSTGGGFGGLGGKKNAGNKIATLSLSSLLVVFVSLIII